MNNLCFVADRRYFSRVLFRCLLFICVFSMLLSNGYAQTEDEPSDEFVLEDTVVTATKTGETKLQETPISITALDDEALNIRSSFNLEDIAFYSPNTQVWSRGGKQTYYIRGIGNSSTSYLQEPNVAIYVDGVYMERGLAVMTDFVDVERVEVLRGPQGTLYGRNSTGGAINIITKAPTDELELTAAVEVGNYEKLRFDGSISGPIMKDKLNTRVTVSKSQQQGQYDIVEGPDNQDIENNTVRGALDWIINDQANFLIKADYNDSEDKSPNGKLINDDGLIAFFGNYTAPDGFYEAKMSEQNDRDTNNQGLSGHLTYELPFNMTLRSITAYREYDEDTFADADYIDADTYHTYSEVDNTTVSQELQLDGSHEEFDWLVGYFYYHMDETQYLKESYDIAMFGLVYDDFINMDIETEAHALYGSGSYQLTEQFSLGAGVRYSYEKKNATITYEEPGFYYSEVEPEDEWEAVTPKVFTEYKITDDAMIFGSIANGFRAGTFYPWNQPEEEISLDPETNWSYEIGFKSDWANNRLRINGAAFYSIYDDMQVDIIVTDPLTGLPITNRANAAEAEIKGAELEILAMPMQALTLNLTVGYLDATYSSFDDAPDGAGGTTDLSGNDLPFVPEWQMNAGAQYVFDLNKNGYVTLRGDVSYQDEIYFTQYNKSLHSRDSLTLVNTFIRYETSTSRWSVELYCKNLFDEEYYTMLAPGGDQDDLVGDVGTPRTFGVQAVFNY